MSNASFSIPRRPSSISSMTSSHTYDYPNSSMRSTRNGGSTLSSNSRRPLPPPPLDEPIYENVSVRSGGRGRIAMGIGAIKQASQ